MYGNIFYFVLTWIILNCTTAMKSQAHAVDNTYNSAMLSSQILNIVK